MFLFFSAKLHIVDCTRVALSCAVASLSTISVAMYFHTSASAAVVSVNVGFGISASRKAATLM